MHTDERKDKKDKWNKIKDPELDQHKCGQLIYLTKKQMQYNVAKIVFSTNNVGKRHLHARK